MSLTLVMGGSSSIATPSSDPPTPSDAEVEALLRDAIEADDAAPDLAVVGDDAADVEAPDDDAALDDTAAPDAEVAAPPSAVDDAPSTPVDDSDPEADDGVDAAPQASDLTPFFVPPGDPGPGQAKLIIRTGGDRTGTGPTSTTVTPLEGASFEFFRTNSPNNLTGGTPTGQTCTTDETGACGVFLALDPGVNYFYAVQTGAPAGWIIPTAWEPGTNYRFSTRLGVNSSGTPAERTQFLPQQIPGTAPDPVWASVRPNPAAPPQCGLDLAMVVDLSNSVTDSSALLAQYKDAATTFVDTLTGTPSRVALHTFATNAPADGPSNAGLPLTSVATASGASALTARINNFTATPQNVDGGTNWDRGFHQVVESGEQYDVVLFLTDGAPTFHRNGFGTGSTTNIREVNEAILSANAVKATGAQVVLVGIGPAAFLPGADIRIPLVSGPVEGADFVRANFDELAETLEEIATANCAGTLTVVKEVVDVDGDVTDGGAGWNFTTPTAGVTPASATTDATSAVNFAVSYPDDLTRPVTVNETPQDGFELAQVGGQNAVCVDTAVGTPVPVTNVGELGFTVDVPAADIISCTVRNAEVPPDYDDLTVTKTVLPSFVRDYDWEIEKLARVDRIEVPAGDDATFTYDVNVTPSEPIDSGFEVAGTISVTNPNDDVTFTGVNVNDAIAGLPGSTCTVTGGTGLVIAPGATFDVAYSCAVAGATASTAGTNTATATWDAAAYPGTSGTAATSQAFDFATTAPSVTDGVVVVTDSEIDLADYDDGTQVGNVVQAVDGPAVFTYEMDWPGVAGQCADYSNTATIVNGVGPAIARADIGILAVNDSSTEIVTVCAGLDLDVEKNVVQSFDRTYLWTIDKVADETLVDVDPATGIATFDYTVTATPVLPPNGWTDSAWAMSGAITVTNPNEWLDITADVTDVVDVGGGATCAVTGGTGVLVGAGETVTLEYLCTFTAQPSYTGTNTATATWADDVPTPTSSATGTAAVAADAWSVTPVNDVIDVMDDQTDPANPVDLGPATWNATGTPTVFEYSLEQEGTPGECVDFTNTAWIVQTQQEASEVVTACLTAPLEVTKTAEASFDRTYLWDITKDVDATTVTVDDETGEAVFNYTVNAVPAGSADDGWTLGGEISVTNPNTFESATVTVTDAADVGGGAVCTVVDGVGVEIAAGGTEVFDYSCSFTAEPDYEGVNTATVVADGETFTGTADVTFELDDETDDVVNVIDDQTDPANPVTLGQATWNAVGTPTAFTYSLTHEGVPGQCVDFTNTAWVDVEGDDPSDEQTVEVCVTLPLEVEKTAVSANQLATGDWQVSYQIEVVNPATFGREYSLTDTLEFGGGIDPITASWTLADPADDGEWTDPDVDLTAVLATDRPLAGSSTHTYTVTVVADIVAGVVGTDAAQCSGDDGTDGGGFLNAATLTADEQVETVRDCLEPAAPSILKTFEELTENDDGTWDVVYTVAVANPDDETTVSYDLVDEPAFVSGAVIVEASVVNTSPGDIVTNPDFDAVTDLEIVSGQLLSPETTDVYTVTVTVDLSELAAVGETESRECGVNGSNGGRGLFNEATITSGNDEYDSEACVNVPDPELDVDKTAVSAIQNADGSWTVTYDVVAANVSSVGALYDLTDTIEFGDGITPTAASWTLADPANAGAWADPAGEPTTVLAADRPLAGGDSHTYTVVVDATLEAGVIGSDPGRCENYLGEDGGFLNSVTLTVGDDEITDEDCLEPELPDLEKLFGSAVQLPDGTWGVTYTLVVDNSDNDSRAFYDLSDAPHFADGVTILDQAVLDVTDAENPVEIAWDGTAAIAEDVEVAAGDVHTYQVTFNVEVSAGIPADDLECEPGQGGRGFFNSATLTTGPDTIDDDDCGPIIESVVPSVTKTVADDSPVLNADGTWTIVYDVLITTPEANTLVATYELSDELDFGEGITVLDADVAAGNPDTPAPLGSWTGIAPDIAVTDGEVLLPAGVSHVYTVTVDATVGEGVIGTEAGECYTAEVPRAGGFLNTVTLTTDGIERTDDACAEPEPAPWTLEKTSDPVSGSTVDPGDVITYTLTATPTGDQPPLGVYVRDDLSDVLEHAAGYGDIVASTGTTSWDGDVLVWDIGTLAETATLTYSVIVDDDAWNVTLVNVATGGPTPPTCIGDCSTTHITPPRPDKPDLPTTGAQLSGWIAAAFVLTLAGLALTTVRRRRQT